MADNNGSITLSDPKSKKATTWTQEKTPEVRRARIAAFSDPTSLGVVRLALPAWAALLGHPKDRDPKLADLDVTVTWKDATCTCKVRDIDSVLMTALEVQAVMSKYQEKRSIRSADGTSIAPSTGQDKLLALFGEEEEAAPPVGEVPPAPPAA